MRSAPRVTRPRHVHHQKRLALCNKIFSELISQRSGTLTSHKHQLSPNCINTTISHTLACVHMGHVNESKDNRKRTIKLMEVGPQKA